MPADSPDCPKCGSKETQPAVVLRRRDHPMIRHLGGWFLATLWGASRGEDFRCVQCEAKFVRTTNSSLIARVLLIFFLVLIALGALMEWLR